MNLLRIINAILILLIILTLTAVAATVFFPENFQTMPGDLPVSETLSPGTPAAATIPNAVEAAPSKAAPVSRPSPEKTARFFPLPPEPEPLPAPAVTEPPEEPEPEPVVEIRYNESRLSYLGFTVDADDTSSTTYLLKDTLYDDIFGISEGEVVRGFRITAIEEGSLFLNDGEEDFKVFF